MMRYILYDGVSSIIWDTVYELPSGVMSVEEMKQYPQLEELFTKPSVLFQENGITVDWRLLEVLCSQYDIPMNELDIEGTFDSVLCLLTEIDSMSIDELKKKSIETRNQLSSLTSSFEPEPNQTNEVLSQLSLAMSYVVQNQDLFSDEQALAVSTIYPEWHTGVDYRAKQVCRYNNELYRCAQAHTSSEQNNPTVASLWTKITIDPETGYDVWQQPSGSHDAYNIGDRVLYPDENGQVYESLINGNTWSPEAYPAGWKLIEE